jgi:hypothetical protein
MKSKRYNWWGKRIKTDKTYKYDIVEDEIEEYEPSERSYNWIWALMLFIVIIPMLIIMMGRIGNINIDLSTKISGEYTINIYVPDCDDELIYTENNVQGQYLYDNGLGKLQSDEFKPSTSFQKWENYLINKTGFGIPNDGCCVEFIKEV